MKQIVPICKELKFNTNVFEICSISLEHELNKKSDELLGDFVISGEFKTHELSVNKEKFLFRVPFSVDLTDNIVLDSIKFDILDFNYELKDNNLVVDIEFEVDALEKEENSVLDDIDFISVPDNNDTEDNRNEVEDKIMDSIVEDDDNIVYKIHIVRENETIENICTTYNVLIEDIKSYNDIKEIKIGDKIIIPTIND